MHIDTCTLHDIFEYAPESGKLFWKERSELIDPRPQQRKLFNARFAGKEAFTSKNSEGYFCGKLLGVSMKAHTVIWAYYTGEWPDGEIDHIDGDRGNNRIENLRCVDKSTNQRNASRREDNTSGQVGVSFHKASGRWNARISTNGRRVFLGSFPEFEDAVAARKAAEAELGYHENHGRAA